MSLWVNLSKHVRISTTINPHNILSNLKASSSSPLSHYSISCCISPRMICFLLGCSVSKISCKWTHTEFTCTWLISHNTILYLIYICILILNFCCFNFCGITSLLITLVGFSIGVLWKLLQNCMYPWYCYIVFDCTYP